MKLLFHNNGQLLSYDEFLNKFQLLYGLQSMQLSLLIPSGLIQLIRPVVIDFNITFDFTLKLQGAGITDKRCDNIFLRRISRSKRIPLAESIWSSVFHDIEWEKAFMISREYCVTNKVREVSFKMIHCIYPVSQILKIYKIDM